MIHGCSSLHPSPGLQTFTVPSSEWVTMHHHASILLDDWLKTVVVMTLDTTKVIGAMLQLGVFAKVRSEKTEENAEHLHSL